MPAQRLALGKLTALPDLTQAAECLRALAHPQRLRLLQMLRRGRFTVGDLAAGCGILSHTASEHLRLLQRCGFLQAERDGRRAYYVIVDPLVHDILAGIERRFGKGQAR